MNQMLYDLLFMLGIATNALSIKKPTKTVEVLLITQWKLILRTYVSTEAISETHIEKAIFLFGC